MKPITITMIRSENCTLLFRHLNKAVKALGNNSRFESQYLEKLARYLGTNVEEEGLSYGFADDLKQRTALFQKVIANNKNGATVSRAILKETGLRLGIDIYTVQAMIHLQETENLRVYRQHKESIL